MARGCLSGPICKRKEGAAHKATPVAKKIGGFYCVRRFLADSLIASYCPEGRKRHR